MGEQKGGWGVTKARRLEEGPGLELGMKRSGRCIRRKHQKKGRSKNERKTMTSLISIPLTWQNPKGNQLAKELEKYRLQKGGYRAEKQLVNTQHNGLSQKHEAE